MTKYAFLFTCIISLCCSSDIFCQYSKKDVVEARKAIINITKEQAKKYNKISKGLFWRHFHWYLEPDSTIQLSFDKLVQQVKNQDNKDQMDRMMSEYTISMLYNAKKKTNNLRILLDAVTTETDPKIRKEAWKSLHNVLKSSDLEALKKISKQQTGQELLEISFYDLSVCYYLDFNEITTIMNDAVNTEENDKIVKQAEKLLKLVN